MRVTLVGGMGYMLEAVLATELLFHVVKTRDQTRRGEKQMTYSSGVYKCSHRAWCGTWSSRDTVENAQKDDTARVQSRRVPSRQRRIQLAGN